MTMKEIIRQTLENVLPLVNLDSDFLMENLITDDTDEDDNIIKFDDNII